MNNTLIRAVSGIVFLIIMTGGIVLDPVIYFFVMLFAIIVMNKEYISIAFPGKISTPSILTLLTSSLIFTTTYLVAGYEFSPKILYINIIGLIFIYISILYSKRAIKPEGTTLIGSALYTALPFSLMNITLFDVDYNYNYKILLSFFLIIWASDVGAYIFGMSFGQKNGHKLFPSISPKKSWEGFYGGLVVAMVTSLVLYKLNFLDINLIQSIVLGLIINIFGVFGDLIESLFKRNYGVKDSGKIMPGHGGLLDRFDGALIAFPTALAYLEILKLF